MAGSSPDGESSGEPPANSGLQPGKSPITLID